MASSGKKIERGANRQCDVDQVGDGGAGSHGIFVNGAASMRFDNDFGTIPANDLNVWRKFAESQGEGPTDQAGAENRDAVDKMAHVRLYVISFFPAVMAMDKRVGLLERHASPFEGVQSGYPIRRPVTRLRLAMMRISASRARNAGDRAIAPRRKEHDRDRCGLR